MEVDFRAAGTADIDLLVRLMRKLYEFDHISFDQENARRGLVKLLDDESLGRVWLIRHAGETAGYVVLTFGFSLEFHGRDALVDEIYLTEDYRGRGIGRRALEFVFAFCRSHGIDAVHLEVEKANTRARALYLKAGFADHTRHFMTKWISG